MNIQLVEFIRDVPLYAKICTVVGLLNETSVQVDKDVEEVLDHLLNCTPNPIKFTYLPALHAVVSNILFVFIESASKDRIETFVNG